MLPPKQVAPKTTELINQEKISAGLKNLEHENELLRKQIAELKRMKNELAARRSKETAHRSKLSEQHERTIRTRKTERDQTIAGVIIHYNAEYYPNLNTEKN